MENPYQSPAAEIIDPGKTTENQLYYVVSVTKMLVLAIITFNLYLVYWFYRHWKAQEPYVDGRIYPVMRGLFSIFFTVSLFQRISEDLDRRNLEKSWRSGGLAAAYIVLSVISNVLESFSRNSESFNLADGIGWVMVIVIPLVLVPVQRRANLVSDDPEGSSNAGFTWANWLWLGLFLALWGLIGFGVLVTLVPESFA